MDAERIGRDEGNGQGTGLAEAAEPLSVSRPELLIDGSDARFRELIYALFVTGRRFREAREAFGREMGITGPQYFILIGTAHQQDNGGASIRSLADYLHVAASHVTTEVNKLVERGLLQKQANPADGRSVLVSLTDAGRKALARLAPYRRHINDVLFDGFTAEEFQTLARLLDRFVGTTERALEEIESHERRRARDAQTTDQSEGDEEGGAHHAQER